MDMEKTDINSVERVDTDLQIKPDTNSAAGTDISSVIKSRAAERGLDGNLSARQGRGARPSPGQTAVYFPHAESGNMNGGAGKPPGMKQKPASRRGKSTEKRIYYGIAENSDSPAPPHTRGKPEKRSEHSRSRGAADTAAAENPSQENERLRRRQNIAGLRRTLLIFALLLTAAAAAYGFYVLTSVREIVITGSSEYCSERILDFCNLQTGHNIFAYDLSDIEEKINSVPELTVISIKRALPNRIEITVTDHAPKAAIPSGNGAYTVIDSDGCVMSMGQTEIDELIIIKGLTLSSFKPGKRIDCEASLSLRSCAAAELLRALNILDFRNGVTGIDVSNISCVKLNLKQDFTIILGAYPEAMDNMETAAKAYRILLPNYPSGGIINVFNNKTTVDFTPNTPDN